MALWLVRAGKYGEHETRFIENSSVYCTWMGLDWDMSSLNERAEFKEKVRQTYPDDKEGSINSSVGQLWSFSHRIAVGDIIATPSKIKSVIYFGEVVSDYKYKAEDALYRHSRKVKWIKEAPRFDIEQDILYSLGSILTICSISRNNAEQRIRKLLGKPTATINPSFSTVEDSEDDKIAEVDIEDAAIQEITDRLNAKFKGHGLASVVAAILEAKGYTTLVSPPGPDNGVDILASRGALGFENPRICVQVKSEQNPIGREKLDQLIGVMKNHKAEFGMLVSWGGFRSSITKEEASHFFEVRLWTHKEIVQEFLHHYEELPEEIRETIPLKRVWVIDKREI